MSTHGTEIVNSLQKRVLKMEKGKLVRDDKKGGYSEVDEFALKVLGEDGTEDDEKKENSNKKKSERKEKEEKEQKVKKENNSGKDSKNTDKTDKTGKKDSKKQVEKETPKVSKKEEKELDELIHKADVSGLGVLELNKDLEKKLQKEGFDDVEDILSAGIGEVNKHLNQKQIRQLAKAIKKFVTTE
jgi:signal recognition particle GTPase